MVSIICFLTSISCGGLVMVGRTYTHSAGKSPFFLVRIHSPIHQPEFITVSPFCWSRTIRSPLLKDRKEEPSPTERKNHVRQQKQSVNTVHLVYLTHSLLAPLQKSTVNFYLGQPYLWFTIMIGKLVCSYQYNYVLICATKLMKTILITIISDIQRVAWCLKYLWEEFNELWAIFYRAIKV